MKSFKEYVKLRENRGYPGECSWCGDIGTVEDSDLCRRCYNDSKEAWERTQRGKHPSLCAVCGREVPKDEPMGKWQSGPHKLMSGISLHQTSLCKNCMAEGWTWSSDEGPKLIKLGRQPWTRSTTLDQIDKNN